MAYTVTIEAPGALGRPETPTIEHAPAAPGGSLAQSAHTTGTIELRRLRRVVAYGPRCPDCTGPLVFGEGCHLCPICGYSACGAA